MRYLSIYLPSTTKPALVIDLHKPDRPIIRDAIYLTDFHDAVGYKSNFKDIFTATFPRTAETTDPQTSQMIKLSEVPQRFSSATLIDLLESLQVRGKDKVKRQMNSKSLANLKPARPFTKDNHPIKPRRLDDLQVQKAAELRAQGCSWKVIGDRLSCPSQTVRSTLKRLGSEIPIEASNSSY
jgi:hypothetical protein